MNKHMDKSSRPELDPETGGIAHTLEEMANEIHPTQEFASALNKHLLSAHPGPRAITYFALRRLAPVLLWIVAIGMIVLVLEWAIRSLAPQPVPAARATRTAAPFVPAPPVGQSTPAPSGQGYDWNGTKLYMAAALPDSPSEVDVYLARPGQHASLEEAIALAGRFGIQGEVYATSGELPDTTDYTVTDGKQSLQVRSAEYFTYTANIIDSFNNFSPVQNPDANTIIDAFLNSHGFTLPHRIEWSAWRSAYMVDGVAPDGAPLRYEHFAPPMALITLSEDGTVATMQASLLGIQNDPVGRNGMVSAEEAMRRLLEPGRVDGTLAGANSIPAPIQEWKRVYPMDQSITIYGTVSALAPVDSTKPPFVQIDGYPVIGKISGLEQYSRTPYAAISGKASSGSQIAYIEATGRFVSENGMEKFSVENWQVTDKYYEDGLVGILQRENDQVMLQTEDGTRYTLPDVPADVPMPLEGAFVVGTKIGSLVEWKLIDNRMASGGGGGGGGGGGTGFYRLNLTGTPVPFPTATEVAATVGTTQYAVQAGDTVWSIAQSHRISAEELMQANGITDPGLLTIGQSLTIPGSEVRQVQGLRGILNITINKQPDESQFVSYGFLANAASVPGGYMLLEGSGLEALQAYNSRPVDIWGSFQNSSDGGIPKLTVDHFEIPFPDLQVRVFTGTQKLTEIAGQPATLFTSEEGETYVQLLADATTGSSLIGVQGDAVQLEAVAVPGETVDGRPALRVFGGMLAIDPKSGLHTTLPITVDRPVVVEVPFSGRAPELPTATLEKIELIHFLADPRHAVPQADAHPLYFQPAWRFYGHYSNGDEFEVLIQALRDEFLLPEVEPAPQPG